MFWAALKSPQQRDRPKHGHGLSMLGHTRSHALQNSYASLQRPVEHGKPLRLALRRTGRKVIVKKTFVMDHIYFKDRAKFEVD